MKRCPSLVAVIATVLWGGIANAATPGAIDLGTAKGGPVVLHGNMLMTGNVPDSVFHFEAVPLNGGSACELLINGFGVLIPKVRGPQVSNPRFDARQAVDSAKDAFLNARFVATGTLPSSEEIVDTLVALYKRQTGVVSDAFKESDLSYRVCWVGDDPGDCEGFRMPEVTNNPPDPIDEVRKEAGSIQLALRCGRVVFVRESGLVVPSGREKATYLAEYYALKKGTMTAGQSTMREKDLAQSIARPPVTLELLKFTGSEK